MLFSAVFKARARDALKNHWQTALLIALVVQLPSLLVQGLSAFTGNDLTVRLQDLLMEAAQSSLPVTSDDLLAQAWAIVQEPGILTMLGLGVLSWLITPFLALGMNHWALDRLRGLDEPFTTVFSRLNTFLKGIALRLLIALKILLWTLPGIGVMLCSQLPLLGAQGKSDAEILSALETGISIMYLGMAVAVVLGVFAYLHYDLADLILADEPEERVVMCVRRSKALMAGRKKALLSLLLSFALWYLLIILASSFAASILGTVIGLMLQMLGSLCLSVYVLLSECAFYESLRVQPVTSD